jgi:hypothetical protein
MCGRALLTPHAQTWQQQQQTPPPAPAAAAAAAAHVTGTHQTACHHTRAICSKCIRLSSGMRACTMRHCTSCLQSYTDTHSPPSMCQHTPGVQTSAGTPPQKATQPQHNSTPNTPGVQTVCPSRLHRPGSRQRCCKLCLLFSLQPSAPTCAVNFAHTCGNADHPPPPQSTTTTPPPPKGKCTTQPQHNSTPNTPGVQTTCPRRLHRPGSRS